MNKLNATNLTQPVWDISAMYNNGVFLYQGQISADTLEDAKKWANDVYRGIFDYLFVQHGELGVKPTNFPFKTNKS